VVNEDAASQRQYPVPCPACGAVTGYPIAVQTVRAIAGHIRVVIACQACKVQWFQQIEIDRQ
jgi:hypothetical protein